MEDKSSTSYDVITVDTSVFDSNGLKLESGILSQLKQFKNSEVKFILSDIVAKEIKAHLFDVTQKAYKSLESSIRKSKDHLVSKSYDFTQIEYLLKKNKDTKSIAEERFNEFIQATGCEIIDSNENVTLSELTNKYFENEAPFAVSGKKKNEFPDAIALLAIQNWSLKNGFKTIAISEDNDWASFCNSSEVIDCNEKLTDGLALFHIDANSAETFVDEADERTHRFISRLRSGIINNSIRDFNDGVEKAIEEGINYYDVDADASSDLRFEIESASLSFSYFKYVPNEDGIIDFKVIDASKDYLVISTTVEINFDVDAEVSFSTYDSIDREDIYLGSSTVSKSDSCITEILISLSGNIRGDINNLSIDEVEIIDRPNWIDLDYVEPDWDR